MAGNWLSKYLNEYQQGQQDILEPTGRAVVGPAPAAGENAPQPTGAVGGGASVQPAGVNPLLAQFIQRLSARNRKRGLTQDPLTAAIGSRHGLTGAYGDTAGAPGAGPVSGGDLGVTEAGPRAGQARAEYNLGNGQFAHVYIDRNGKRQVQVFRR